VSSSPFHRLSSARRSVQVIVVAGLSSVALMLAGTASASASAQYWLHNSKTAPNTHCYAGYGYVDLLPFLPSGTTTLFTGGARMACTQPFPGGATLSATTGNPDPALKGQLKVWFTNTNKKSCTTSWYLYNNATPTHAGDIIAGSYYEGGKFITVPANTTTPTEFTVNFDVEDRTLAPDDQLQLHVNTRTASGACSKMTLYYGSADRASNVLLPTLVALP
jgi:hypothetical protein